MCWSFVGKAYSPVQYSNLDRSYTYLTGLVMALKVSIPHADVLQCRFES